MFYYEFFLGLMDKLLRFNPAFGRSGILVFHQTFKIAIFGFTRFGKNRLAPCLALRLAILHCQFLYGST